MSLKVLRKLMQSAAAISISIFLLFAVSACKEEFRVADVSLVQTRWEESVKHSAVSWWYLGEKDGYYYVLEKWPMERHGYKVSMRDMLINTSAPKELTFDQNEWINLKVGQIQFK